MTFCASLIVVADMNIARAFYESVLGQKVSFDFGENIMFESGISLQLKPHYAKLLGIGEDKILSASHNFELYFEEENLDAFAGKLESHTNIRYIQRLVEHSWGQRVIRFYDPDMHIIEVGESMKSVVQRLLSQGMTPEETAAKTQHPLDFIIS